MMVRFTTLRRRLFSVNVYQLAVTVHTHLRAIIPVLESKRRAAESTAGNGAISWKSPMKNERFHSSVLQARPTAPGSHHSTLLCGPDNRKTRNACRTCCRCLWFVVCCADSWWDATRPECQQNEGLQDTTQISSVWESHGVLLSY